MKKIIFEKEKCIGCGACTMVCPTFWKMGEEGKAELIGGEENPETGNMELSTEEAGCNMEASQGCPAECIKIEN